MTIIQELRAFIQINLTFLNFQVKRNHNRNHSPTARQPPSSCIICTMLFYTPRDLYPTCPPEKENSNLFFTYIISKPWIPPKDKLPFLIYLLLSIWYYLHVYTFSLLCYFCYYHYASVLEIFHISANYYGYRQSAVHFISRSCKWGCFYSMRVSSASSLHGTCMLVQNTSIYSLLFTLHAILIQNSIYICSLWMS